MTRSNRNGIVLAALAAVLISGEWTALRAATPRGIQMLNAGRAGALLTAGRSAFRGISSGAKRGAERLVGSLVLLGVNNTNRAYELLLRMTPGNSAAVAEAELPEMRAAGLGSNWIVLTVPQARRWREFRTPVFVTPAPSITPSAFAFPAVSPTPCRSSCREVAARAKAIREAERALERSDASGGDRDVAAPRTPGYHAIVF